MFFRAKFHCVSQLSLVLVVCSVYEQFGFRKITSAVYNNLYISRSPIPDVRCVAGKSFFILNTFNIKTNMKNNAIPEYFSANEVFNFLKGHIVF